MAVLAWSTDIKPTIIHNCFRHCKIRLEVTDAIPIDENELLDQAFVEELESQICQFRYSNPVDIRNLLNYPAEDEVAYVTDVYDVVNDQLSNASDDGGNADDDSQEHPSISLTEAHKMLQTLQLLWMQQEVDSQDFLPSLQHMKDIISKINVN